MRNPFAHDRPQPGHAQAHRREAYGKTGWGSTVVRNVPQAQGDPLVFQFQLPDDLRLFEMSELVAAAEATQQAPAWVHDQGVALKAAAEVPGMILVGAICPADDPAEVISTVTAFTSPQAAPLQLKEGDFLADGAKVSTMGSFQTDDWGHQDFLMLIYNAGHPPVTMLTLNYFVIDEPGGRVALAFASLHKGMGGTEGRDFFRRITQSTWFGPPDLPD